MLDAARAAVRFCCPNCGAGLRASPAEAGTAVSCHLCGEAVRVPHKPHPRECDLADLPLLPTSAASSARAGVRLLHLAVAVAVAEYLVRAAVLGYWAVELGPAKVLGREAGALRGLLFAAWLLDLALVTVRVWLQWHGYRRCEPAAAAVRAGGWVTATRVGLVCRVVGYVAWSLPFGLGWAQTEGPFLVNAVSELGRIVWLAGLVLEFSILFVWARLLTELGGREAARRVTRHAATAVGAVAAFAIGTMLAGIVTVLALRQGESDSPTHRIAGATRLNYDLLPDEAWTALAALIVLAAVCSAVLCLQYTRILWALRAGLTAPRD
jgi:hypothetical protein